MRKEHKYNISFSGLSEGKHHFQFKILKDVLDGFELTDIKDVDIDAEVEMIKSSGYLSFDINFKGKINLQCDRCLDYFDHYLDFSNKLYINFGEETSDLSDVDEQMVLSRKEDKIDLSKHFYDYINLQVPLKIIHPDDEAGNSTCNHEMIEKLEKYLGGEEEKDIEKTDPRWDKLKNLYN